MKNAFCLLPLGLLSIAPLPPALAAAAPAPSPLGGAAGEASGNKDRNPAGVRGEPGPAVIVSRDAHSRRWERSFQETLPNGRVRTHTSGYTELGANLHYPDPNRPGAWLESKEEIELFQDGAVARQGAISVIWAPNLATPAAIDLQMADGKRLRTHVLGLALHDTATGRSELFAEVQDSLGELHPPNVIIYPDAFTDVKASVRYTYNKDRFEQDIILYERLALPAGFNPATTRLEIWTEAVDPPAPAKTVRAIGGNVADEILDFGAMRIGSGRAFQLEDPQGRAWSVPMFKQWTTTAEGRTFLIEAVEYQAVQAALEALPAPAQGAAVGPPAAPGPRRQMAVNGAGQRTFPALQRTAKAGGKVKVVQTAAAEVRGEKSEVRTAAASSPSPLPQRGLVLDYSIVATTSATLKGGETYLISSPLTLTGTNIIEGDVVIKAMSGATLTFAGPVDCRTDSYRPAVFTSRDDDTVGEIIAGSTGNPWTNYVGTAIRLDGGSGATDLKHLRISHAQTAFACDYDAPGPHLFSHAQLVHCQIGFQPLNTFLKLRNVLLTDVLTNFHTYTYAATGLCEHLTINRADRLANNSSLFTLLFTNCLLVAVTNSGTYTGANNSTASDPAAVFQTVGAGAHYLLNNTYRNAGTVNIDSNLLADLRKRTTYPPILITNDITLDTTLSPQAQRDVDLPDLGWHAAPLDYLVKQVAVTNATLTLTNGVALGMAGSYGLAIVDGGRLVSEGRPLALNRLVLYDTVQESPGAPWAGCQSTLHFYNYGVGSSPSVRCRYTEFSALAQMSAHFYGDGSTPGTFDALDCQFSGSYLTSYRATLRLTNSLLQRVSIQADDSSYGPFDLAFRNTLLLGGSLTLLHYDSGTWAFHDNLFDNPSLSQDGAVTNSYNAYTTNLVTTRLSPNSATDLKLAVTNVTYDTGPLGRFYLAAGSTLLNAGSRNATNAGLYHFTTLVAQTKETNSVVDLSFHYVALNLQLSTLNPFDGESDGYSDYAEDRTGNGSYDSALGETDWKAYNSKSGIGPGPGLVVFTPLK